MTAEKRNYVYIGITSSLYGHVMQHKRGELDGLTKRYNITRLSYFRYVNNAIARETELKKWRRAKKVALIEGVNPTWEDLAADWGTPVQPLVTADSSLRSE